MRANVYISDIYVFIGAHSDVNQAQWYWNDQTVATDTRFSSPSLSRCQQAAIKYNYLDPNRTRSWVFTSENCTGSLAHYVCEIKGERIPKLHSRFSTFCNFRIS